MTGNEYQKLAMRTNDGLSSPRLVDWVGAKDALLTSAYHLQPGTKFPEAELNSAGGVIHACLGLSGEVGELTDMMKKAVFHEKTLDEDHLAKELGDVLWYVALFCESAGWDLDEIMQLNIDKLKKRYPEGFDVDRANNRKEGDI